MVAYGEIHKENANTLSAQNTELINTKHNGTHSYQWAFKGQANTYISPFCTANKHISHTAEVFHTLNEQMN